MNKLSLILTLMSVSAFGGFTDLQGQKITPENESSLFYSSVSYAIARQGQRSIDSNSLVLGYSEIVDRIFSISSDMEIVSTKKEDRTVINNWPLTRWEGETSNNQFNQFTALNSDDYPANALRQKIWSSRKGLGCYNETPLRYGDVEGDGEKEIVLLVGEVNHNLDMLVFLPSQGKSVFGVRLAVHDSQENVYGEYSKYDYISTLDLRSAYQASRLYAKVFAGDFNQQDTGTYDLLVWRKAYWANLKTQTPTGFSLKASLLSHFALIDGEYVLQNTDQATIQTWLSENKLTWSKGFPSVSECEGEEGKLIPEMHDPLLNDPDVLQ